ncbi:type II secretion system F family protein [Paenibacillus sp. GYB003]|uniref:type II secretion system F family protein n=1 Tax=Paenibacillus sp. GYB003 TaxID=2994392 RepID=UPI002F96E511
MLIWVVKSAFLLLLFMLAYLFFHRLLQTVVRRSAARYRLNYVRRGTFANRVAQFASRYNWLYRHLADLLESIQARLHIGTFLFVSVLLLLAGIVGGFFCFRNAKGVLSAGGMLGLLPYLALRMRLLSLQMKARLDFLPAVELFYQYYIVSGQSNIRTALKITLEENRMQPALKPVFEQLYRHLATSRDPEHSLRVFALSLGHVWADYFVNILRVGLAEGGDLCDSLKELITDMRRAQRSDQAERNRLLEIRIANFSSILFLLLFLFINFKINPHNAYLYYIVDPAGRNMLLDGLLLIFASVLMGIYLSIRRM